MRTLRNRRLVTSTRPNRQVIFQRLLCVAWAILVALGNRASAQSAPVQRDIEIFFGGEKDKGKEKEKKARSLEELLAEALKHNPDIGVAESKLREAEAELNRVRLQVTQKLIAQQRELAQAQALVEEGNAKYQTAKELQKRGAIAQEEYRAASMTLQKLKADLSRIESKLPYLLGTTPGFTWKFHMEPEGGVRTLSVLVDHASKQPASTSSGTSNTARTVEERIIRLWSPATGKVEATPLSAATADKMRKALDTSIKVDFAQVSPKQILELLQQHAKGFNLVEQVKVDNAAPVTLHLKEPVPVGAIFQFLEDQYGWRFVIREYGIVVTEKDRVPPGALDVQNFWKNRPAQTSIIMGSGLSGAIPALPGLAPVQPPQKK